MSGTKRFALRRPQSRRSFLRVLLALSLMLSMALAVPVQGQHLPLPPGEQDAVNEAIGRGVAYLRRTQQKTGTWAKVGVGHRIGYAVLPGLTLLECGVPAGDPLVQQAAHYLRARASKLDTTYELALGILFLDRLGDPQDKKIIQTFALRLIAGQSMTGGWGYKCPLLNATAQRELLTVLRHVDPRPNDLAEIARLPGGMPGIAEKPGGLPEIAGNPGGMRGIARPPEGMPGLAGGPARSPGDLAPLTRVPGGPPLQGVAQQPGKPSLSNSMSRGSEEGSPSLSGGLAGSGLDKALSSEEWLPLPPNRWRDCLGLAILERPRPDPLDSDPPARAGRKDAPARLDAPAEPEPPRPNKPFVIPERIRMLTVLQDPALHILQDPPKKRNDLILTTTDNSNTQFAILALWAAQRYDVPMHRTLNLIVRRYLTSQNIDGTWNYHYAFGGGLKRESFSSPGAMTCVGLIGLAVGHGLAQPIAAGQAVQDPRVLKALIALYQMIGTPNDRLLKVPLENLYYLWSVERVAVLYSMPRIGDKDWYRWGAQMLVTNQETKGNWSGGQYPGNSPTLDTCLALLFLKRANLAKDLTSRLPFKAADLNNGILETLTPPSPPSKTPPKPPEAPESLQKTTALAETLSPQTPDVVPSRPLSSFPVTAPASAAAPEEAAVSKSGSKAKWIMLSLLVFLLFAGGSVFVLFAARRRAEEEETNDKATKKRKNKRNMQSTQ